ncbi:MAG: undecaprenyl-phosphate glucose phosphotransferase [Candidatus Alcyoniella australis]|nr:undecaprenyl-phosphate glucose phosphotransferase [Candidatus Alcyoniella australis]
MIRRERQFLLSIKFVSDLLLLVLLWIASYYIRFNLLAGVLPPPHVPRLDKFLPLTLAVALVWPAVFWWVNIYQPAETPSLTREVFRVLRAHILAMLLFIVVTFFIAEYRPSRVVYALFFALSGVMLWLSRVIFRQVLVTLTRRGVISSRVLIVGAGELGRELARRFGRHRELGKIIVGFITDEPLVEAQTGDGPPILGAIEDVQRVCDELHVDQVYVALPLHAAGRVDAVLKHLSGELVDVKIVPDIVQYITLRGGVEEFEGLPIISLKVSPLYGWRAVGKRLFDVAFALLTLAMISPLLLLIAVLIKLTSPGPVFYGQERMGLDGRTFAMLKFRSMGVNAEAQTGAVWAKKDDPRRTRFGALLRSTSLDELPQFINVLLGHMSVVGPRPERPVFIEKFRHEVPSYMLRHSVKAGITGWAQVNGWRGDTDLNKRIECDLYYIENWSFGLDLRIIFLTVWKGLIAKNAY